MQKKFILKLDEALDEQPFTGTATFLLDDVNLDNAILNRYTFGT